LNSAPLISKVKTNHSLRQTFPNPSAYENTRTQNGQQKATFNQGPLQIAGAMTFDVHLAGTQSTMIGRRKPIDELSARPCKRKSS